MPSFFGSGSSSACQRLFERDRLPGPIAEQRGETLDERPLDLCLRAQGARQAGRSRLARRVVTQGTGIEGDARQPRLDDEIAHRAINRTRSRRA